MSKYLKISVPPLVGLLHDVYSHHGVPWLLRACLQISDGPCRIVVPTRPCKVKTSHCATEPKSQIAIKALCCCTVSHWRLKGIVSVRKHVSKPVYCILILLQLIGHDSHYRVYVSRSRESAIIIMSLKLYAVSMRPLRYNRPKNNQRFFCKKMMPVSRDIVSA